MNTEFYIAECIRAMNTIKLQQTELHSRFLATDEKIVRRESSVGGEMLHRGFYCPSIIQDIVIGNASRGKRLRSERTKQMATYYYGFNEFDQLVTVSHSNEMELIWREDNLETGMVFTHDYGVSFLSECLFDKQRLVSYTSFLYQPQASSIIHLTKENYVYENDRMIVQWISFANTRHPIIQEEEYIFTVEDSFLKEYTVYRNNQRIRSYPVRRKRRIPG